MANANIMLDPEDFFYFSAVGDGNTVKTEVTPDGLTLVSVAGPEPDASDAACEDGPEVDAATPVAGDAPQPV